MLKTKPLFFRAIVFILVSLSCAWNALANSNWPHVGNDGDLRVVVIPSSFEKFGQTIYFSTAILRSDGDIYIFQWHWAHCKKGWISSDLDFAFGLHGLSKTDQFLTAERSTSGGLYSATYKQFDESEIGRSPIFKRLLTERCKTLGQSKSNKEVTVSASESNKDRFGWVERILLRTIINRKDSVEAWVTRSEVVFKPMQIGGVDFVGSDGKIKLLPSFTEFKTMSRVKVAAKCDSRQIATLQITNYKRDGQVDSFADFGSKDSWSEPIPGTIGEARFESLCKL